MKDGINFLIKVYSGTASATEQKWHQLTYQRTLAFPVYVPRKNQNKVAEKVARKATVKKMGSNRVAPYCLAPISWF